jgi:A nuclease of the HNH/ENDO VII superfamily with conserved WHH
MAAVRKYYNNFQKPAGTFDPPFTHNQTLFDDFGHPRFEPDVPSVSGHGKPKYQPDGVNKPKLDGSSKDFTEANKWADETFNVNGQVNFEKIGSTGFRLKDPTSPYAVNGWVDCVWHHHQDAKTLMPVPKITHNRAEVLGSPHTGGAAILKDPTMSKAIGFFDPPQY